VILADGTWISVDKSGETAAGWHQTSPKRVGARSDLPIVANMVRICKLYILYIYNTHDYTCRYASCMHLCIYIDAHAIYLSIYLSLYISLYWHVKIQTSLCSLSSQGDPIARNKIAWPMFSAPTFLHERAAWARPVGSSDWRIQQLCQPQHGLLLAADMEEFMLFCDHWFAFWVAKSTTFADLSKFFHDRRREQNFVDFWTVHIRRDPHVQIIQPLYLL
jgi:hypothetical protein